MQQKNLGENRKLKSGSLTNNGSSVTSMRDVDGINPHHSLTFAHSSTWRKMCPTNHFYLVSCALPQSRFYYVEKRSLLCGKNTLTDEQFEMGGTFGFKVVTYINLDISKAYLLTTKYQYDEG